jgi:hypothetical protein
VCSEREIHTGKYAVRIIRIERRCKKEQRRAHGDCSHHGCDDEEADKIPLLRDGAGNDVVVSNGYKGTVIEQGDEHEHEHGQLKKCRPRLADMSLNAIAAMFKWHHLHVDSYL